MMTDTNDLTARLRASDGFKTFTASDGLPAFKADTELMIEAAKRIEELEQQITEATP